MVHWQRPSARKAPIMPESGALRSPQGPIAAANTSVLRVALPSYAQTACVSQPAPDSFLDASLTELRGHAGHEHVIYHHLGARLPRVQLRRGVSPDDHACAKMTRTSCHGAMEFQSMARRALGHGIRVYIRR